MKKLLLLIILFLSFCQVQGQIYFDLITRYMIDTSFLYQKVRKGIENNEQFIQRNNCMIYPIFQFIDTKPHSKEDYLNYSFLNTLTPLHRITNDNLNGYGWVTKCDRILITNSKGDYLGKSDTYSFCSYYKCECDDVLMINRDSTLSDLLFNHVFDYIFATTEYYPWDDVRIYFGVNKRRKNVSLIFFTNYGIKIMPMEEVINKHWEDFNHETQELIKEIYNELKHSFDSTMKDISYEFCYF